MEATKIDEQSFKRITFTVPGEVRGKMRPKATHIGSYTRVYTPGKQIEYENWVKGCYIEEINKEGRDTIMLFPEGWRVIVTIDIYIAIPKSASKKKKLMMQNAIIRPVKKPDLDNAAKSIMDALNGVAYKDDSQVISLGVAKYYSEEAYAKVELMGGPDE